MRYQMLIYQIFLQKPMSQQVDKLQKKLKRFDEIKNPQPNTLFLKAKTLVQLFYLKNDLELVENAIAEYSKAIEKQKNPIYFCYRAKAFSILGKFNKVIEDLKTVRQIPQGNDVLNNFFVGNMLSQLEKLEDVKQTIEELKCAGLLPENFLSSLNELVSMTETIVIKAGGQDQKQKQNQNGIISFLIKKIQSLQKTVLTLSQYGDQKKQNILEISQKVILYEENLQKLTELCVNSKISEESNKRFDALKLQIEKIDFTLIKESERNNKLEATVNQMNTKVNLSIENNKIQFKNIKNQLKKMVQQMNQYDQKIYHIEGQIDFNKEEIEKINKKMTQIEELIKKWQPKTSLRQKFQELKPISIFVYEYAHMFYWSLSNYFLAFRIAETGMFDGKIPNPSVFQKYFPKCLQAIQTVTQFIPGGSDVIRGVVNIIGFIFETYQDKKFEIMTRKINDKIRFKFQTQLSEQIATGVIQLCKIDAKRTEIHNFRDNNRNEDSYFQSARLWLNKELERFVKYKTDISVRDESNLYKLVTEDVALFITYLGTIHVNDKQSMDQIIVGAFSRNNGQKSQIDKLLIEKYGRISKQHPDPSCCLIW